jgi:hypothetical protein
MAVPFVKDATFADGSGGGTPITAAKLNNIEQGVFDAHLMPAVRVYHNASQSIPSATEPRWRSTASGLTPPAASASTQHDTVTNNSRLTCRYAGKYLITGARRLRRQRSGAQRYTSSASTAPPTSRAGLSPAASARQRDERRHHRTTSPSTTTCSSSSTRTPASR